MNEDPHEAVAGDLLLIIKTLERAGLIEKR